MAFDTFMEIKTPDIAGESTAKGMEGKFEIYSFSWGASNPVTIGSGSTGAGAGKVSLSSFNVMKKSETSSAKLFAACCVGDHFGTITVTMRKASGTATGQGAFLVYKFSECYIESIQWSGSSGGDDTPTESLSIAFAKVEITYSAQGKDGKMAVAGNASWDVTTVSA